MAVHGSEWTLSEDQAIKNNQQTVSDRLQDSANPESNNVVEKQVWKISCEEKRAQRERLTTFFKIPETRLPPPEIRKIVNFLEWEVNHDLLSDKCFKITECEDIEQLLQKLRSGEWRCIEVMVAYIKRATIIHQLTNCFTEVMFLEALKRAQELDELPPNQRGPLYGLPFTVKDQFNVPGFDSTIGYASFIGNAKDLPPSTLVEVLQGQGAIVFAKTNVPQSLMWCETDNNVWGRTNNPRNLDYTPGGSTGGEAVLLAMGGSLLGWGTDIGGSCRIPSALVGCWALRPSSYRLPYQGVTVSTDGQEHVPSVIGPMTRSPESLTFITRQVIQANTYNLDPKVVPIPWREDIYQSTLSKKLRIGLMLDDGVVRVHPPIARLLKWAATILESKGHEIVPWKPDHHYEGVTVMNEFYKADGGADVRSAIEASGEDYIDHCRKLFGPHLAANAIDIPSYWKLMVEKRGIQKLYLDRWNEAGLDLLLTPVMPHVGVKHKHTSWVGYTKIWNVLDYTAAVLPNFGYILADAIKIHETDLEWKQYKPRNFLDEANWALYDPQEMFNQPIAMQLVGRRYEEEKVLGGMQLLCNTLKDYTEIKDEAYFNIIEPAGRYDERGGYQPFNLRPRELRVTDVPSVPRKKKTVEPQVNNSPSEPVGNGPVQLPVINLPSMPDNSAPVGEKSYNFTDSWSSGRLSTILEVSSNSTSETVLSDKYEALTVTPSVCSTDSFVTAGSETKD
ncbi:amidase signature enzyme [Choiromyces venosus 120613-1]|uniref:Amidase signature enzyme n=1 Tax=Choiromyces venosus 120613-1 TaxID=1336337 RepID=A0A3N4JCY8_9PEZI|nr:amidase signature enzyme [Choiromyces venosus 120613-1]